MKRSHFFALLAALPALLVSSCGPAKEASASKGKIGMTCMDLTNPFFQLIANEMTAKAEEFGYEVVALDGANNAPQQNKQIADFIAQGYDAIFLNPADSKAAAEGVRKAHEAGIPVFTFDIQIEDPEVKKLVTSHIGSDNYQGGLLAGEAMMKATGNKGKVAIIGLPDVTSCVLRVNGFKDYLKDNNGKLEIVTELNGLGKRNEGYKVATDLLQAHSDIVGIFAINDPSALGAYEAVAKAKLTDQITIVGFDGTPDGKTGVFEKKLFDTPQQFPRRMAHGTVESFIKHLEGEEVEESIFIPCEHYYYETAATDEKRAEW